ncbi:uncharacterized protein LOC144408008 [Gasterosteus aculeatus]
MFVIERPSSFCVVMFNYQSVEDSVSFWAPPAGWTPQEPTPGSCLWTSALPSTPSSRLCCRTNSPSCTCPTPPASGSQTSCLTGSSTGSWGNMSQALGPSSPTSPQGCVLSPLLFSLYTNSCTSSHQSVKLLKFADDTTLIGLISGGDESAYRWDSDHLVSWCSQNHLELNALKTVQMVVDFRRNRAPPSPITLRDSPVKWELNISSITKKAQQRLFFLRQLKKFNLPKTMMVHFYTAIMESILCSSITVWYAAATAKDKGRLQRVIRSAERVIGCNLPSLQDLFASRSLKRAKKIVADPSHPGQNLFVPLPSGRRLRSIRTKTHATRTVSSRRQSGSSTEPVPHCLTITLHRSLPFTLHMSL